MTLSLSLSLSLSPSGFASTFYRHYLPIPSRTRSSRRHISETPSEAPQTALWDA
jgi:hypothetical protein